MSNLNDSILVNPSDEHIKALLSKLAYENLSTGFNFSNLNSNFSIAEKNYLNENFEVLSVSDSNESGFQGCFLKNTKTNEVIFAIRGTDELKGADADDDLDIINSGMAYKQFIDAYNYYIKTVTATGDIGKLLKYGNQQPTEGTAYIDTGDGHYIYFEDFTGTGNGYSNVSITGHSLGGHLAALLGVVTGNKATIFNAPGYKDQPKLDFSYVSEDGTTENTISMISGIISKLFEKNINSQADVSHIYNDNSQEWIANYGTNWKNSTPIYCLQEENSVHAINEICTAYYAYETIKDIANGAESFTGGVGIDIVYSGQGNDTINTGGNDDIVYTDDSTDSNDVNKVFLGSGNDKFYGGDGIDIVDGGSENPDIEGIYDPTNMVDDEDNENTVHLGGGNDRYTGGIGKDIVYSGTGNDNISTGEGNDHVYTNDTNNKNEDKTIDLGGGDDKFTGGVANDHVTSGSSNDTNNNHKDIDLGEGNNSYVGGDAQDNVTAGSGDDNISTGGGNDIIDTGDGNNTANGGAGDDRMTGGSNNDTLDGGTGKDVLNGKGGNNTINPGNDNDDDTIIAGKGPGKDTVSNFKDNDTIIIPEGIADNRSENGDLIFTTPSGREVILKGRGEPEDPEDEDPQPNLPPNVFDGEGNLYKPDEKGKYRPVDNGLPPFTPDEPNKDKGNTTDGKKHAESQSSPLVVDLDGDGIETLGSGVGIYFDHDNNGFSEDTGWVGKDDGLLVRDINGNGQIDNGTELFGNNTLLSNGEKAKNGFEALKELDSNNDNVFDQNDAAWNEVKVWKDGNSNGVVDDGELLTMEQAGITGVDLNYVDHNYRGDHSDEHGNTCKQEGTFTKTDGSTGQISDIWFDRNTADSKYEAIDVPEDIKTLPNLQGFGNVVSLWEAMASDETGELKQLVEQYLNTTNITERQNLMTDIIYHWTGVEDIDPESRAAAGDNYIQDARIIEALEEFWGSDYVNQNWLGNEESNPRQQASLILIKTFEDLRDSMMGKLDIVTFSGLDCVITAIPIDNVIILGTTNIVIAVCLLECKAHFGQIFNSAIG